MYHKAEQSAIQGGHAEDELALAVMEGVYAGTERAKIFADCLRDHKTHIRLEMNSQFDLIELHNFIKDNEKDLGVPSALFKEPMLNDSVTAICFIAPTKLCKNAHFALRGLQDMLERGVSFEQVEENMEYYCKRSDVTAIYDSESKLFSVIDRSGEQVEDYTYNISEVNLMLMIRFLPKK